jgi:hypothetical protein
VLQECQVVEFCAVPTSDTEVVFTFNQGGSVMAYQARNQDRQGVVETAGGELDQHNLVFLPQLCQVLDRAQPKYLSVHYGSAYRRAKQHMCQSCIAGNHSACPSCACPCLCNDPDSRLPAKTVHRIELQPIGA